MKLSVVIPIYNVGEFVPRCLDSIYSQGIDENLFEVICVNDGSTDNSSAVVKDYALRHENLVLIEQANQGVSVARNNGLDAAKGEFVTFVDPDDSLCEGALGKLFADFEVNGDADMVVCNALETLGTVPDWRQFFTEGRVYTCEEVLNGGFVYGSVWGAYYRMDFIRKNEIRFIPKVRNGEDTNFVMQVLYHTNTIKFTDIDLYVLIGREGSATKVFSKKRIDTMIYTVKTVYEQRKKLILKPGNKIALDYMMYSLMSNLVKDTIATKGVGYRYLAKSGVKECCNFTLSDNTSFLRKKMELLTKSFSLYYFLNRIKG